jgi:hypothetical protein
LAARAELEATIVTGVPATTLAKIANAHFAVRFAICTSGYATQHDDPPISAKTWVAMGRNSGEDWA